MSLRSRLPRRLMRLLPAIFIAGSLLLAVAGNRWGSYLVTPISGLYLSDLLLLLGAATGLVMHVRTVRLSRWVVVTYGIIGLYVLAVLGLEFLRVPDSDRYFALRDAAPFLYLALAPALAMSLTTVGAREAVYFMRAVTAVAVVAPLLVHIGILQPTPPSLLGSEHVVLFGYRTDLTGAVAAIGIVAWSGWSKLKIRANLPVQFAYVLVAGLVFIARSGLVAVVVGIAVLAWLQRGWLRRALVGMGGLLLLIAGLVLSPAIVLGAGTPETVPLGVSPSPSITEGRASAQSVAPEITAVSTEITPPGTEVKPEEAVDADGQRALSDVFGRVGTVSARLDTWRAVVTGMATNGTWFVGGAAGSDYLYELCTGIAEAPAVLADPGAGPKCSVDDYGPEPVVRDPHNWILNIAVTHGVLGVLVFLGVLGATMIKGRDSQIFRLSAWTIGFFLISGLTFLISGGYALVPISVAAAWIVSRAGLLSNDSGGNDEVAAEVDRG